MKYASWHKADAPDSVQRERMTQLCELVLDNVDHEPDCSALKTRVEEACTCDPTREVREMFHDPATGSIWAHSLRRSGSSWTVCFLAPQGVMASQVASQVASQMTSQVVG